MIYQLLGMSSAGPVAGGLVSLLQKSAMTTTTTTMAMAGALGSLGVVASAVVGVVASVSTAAAVCTHHEYVESQKHTMGPPTDLATHAKSATTPPSTKNKFLVLVHNWGTVEVRAFGTYDDAKAAFDGGLKLRRILVRVHNDNEKERDNGHHGWKLPWEELVHAGCNVMVDNDLRCFGLRFLEETASVRSRAAK